MPADLGDWVEYQSRTTGERIGGYVAEAATGVLTGKPRVRVVDFRREASDPDAGRWVDVVHLLPTDNV